MLQTCSPLFFINRKCFHKQSVVNLSTKCIPNLYPQYLSNPLLRIFKKRRFTFFVFNKQPKNKELAPKFQLKGLLKDKN